MHDLLYAVVSNEFHHKNVQLSPDVVRYFFNVSENCVSDMLVLFLLDRLQVLGTFNEGLDCSLCFLLEGHEN